jgi:hypothetical protein
VRHGLPRCHADYHEKDSDNERRSSRATDPAADKLEGAAHFMTHSKTDGADQT